MPFALTILINCHKSASISVGAAGQRSLQMLVFVMFLAWPLLRRSAPNALDCLGGIASSVLRRWSRSRAKLARLRNGRTTHTRTIYTRDKKYAL